ncbi:hypothetical protein V7S43_009564 [Phytophthora oleae]|uniref:Uncharacterized protein n=1 Tax=Phytophthora oleae TaxID=2107226 RepID=A0ABD3FIZ4_9STRA
MEATTNETKATAWVTDVGLLEKKMLCQQDTQPMRPNVNATLLPQEVAPRRQNGAAQHVGEAHPLHGVTGHVRAVHESPQTQAAHVANVTEKAVSDLYAACRVLARRSYWKSSSRSLGYADQATH